MLKSDVTRTRGRAAALGFMKKALKRHGSPEPIEGGKHACPNNRIITTDRLEIRVLHGLQHYMLKEELIEIYVEEYRAEFAKRTKELSREEDRLKKRHGDAVAKIERLVEAVANGAEDFIESAMSWPRPEPIAIRLPNKSLSCSSCPPSRWIPQS